jgi:hypothetical protein
MPQKKSVESLRLAILRLTRTTYLFIALSALAVVLFDAGNVYERTVVSGRFAFLAALLVINTLVWHLAKRLTSELQLQALVWPLIIAELITISFIVYWERGMASQSTLLYAIPIASSAVLKSRVALLTTASFSVASYTFSAVKYFNDYFNEGYRIQLWAQVVLYSGLFFILVWLIMIATGIRKDQQ